MGLKSSAKEAATEYALRYVLSHGGDTAALAEHIEETEGVEILSLGNGLELIKDLGDASDVSGPWDLTILKARTALATPVWQQSPMWIFAQLTPIGHFLTMT